MSMISNAWSYAKRIDGNTTQSYLCKIILSSKGGSTSVVRNHFKGTHCIDVDNSGGSSIAPSMAQFDLPKWHTMTKTRFKELDLKLAAFITQDAWPIGLVEGTGFQSLMKYLELDYQIKTKAPYIELIRKQYNEGVVKLKWQL